MKLPHLCFALILASTGALAQSGSTFYVSKNGNDSNPGNFTAPWLTIQHAADTVKTGATVYVESGIYHEAVNFPNSGTASAPITFTSYPGETAIIDGTGVTCCTSNPPSSGNETEGLITIVNGRYLTISGFEIRNFTTGSDVPTPAGIWITGSGTGVHIRNNVVHNITTGVEKTGNAFGIAAYGTSSTPITQLSISGNRVYDLKTGQSESVNVDGNVTHFTISNNLVHDNDNIGIDAIGFEGVGPAGSDRARYGEISGNTVYNISGHHNPGEGDSYDADGLYCDGCEYVVFERNTIYACDLNMEAASEHKGHDASYVTIRNNVFYNANAVGISIGGYSSGVGGSDHIVIVNNTLYNNNTKNQGAEFQIQFHSGSKSGNIFENNIVYAGSQNVWIYSFVRGSTTYPAPPATLNWNLYHSKAGYGSGTSIDWAAKSSYKTFAAYQADAAEDTDSQVANPEFISVGSNFDIKPTSPAVATGSTNLTCAVGYCGSSTSIYGTLDYAGNPRLNPSGQINIGAYEQ